MLLVACLAYPVCCLPQNNNSGTGSAIPAGSNNTTTAGSFYNFIGAGALNTNSENNSFIGSGVYNKLQSARSAIVAGTSNQSVNSINSFIGGGEQNLISNGSTNSFIGAGWGNLIDSNSPHSFIGSGKENYINSLAKRSFIGGGSSNEVTYAAEHSFIGGGYMNNIASYSNCVIAGGAYNTNAEFSSFIGGGENNTLERGRGNALVAGMQNLIGAGTGCFIGGGEENWIDSSFIIRGTTIAGGLSNRAKGNYSVISGGSQNLASNSYATVAGGLRNKARGDYAAVLGGSDNDAWGASSGVMGGFLSSAGPRSFAAGCLAKATNAGSFVWNGQSNTITSSTNDNSFTVRCQGGARFLTTSQTNNAQLVGVRLNGGATAWAVLSDSNAKTDFQPIRQREVLSKVASLPVRAWEYKHDPGRRYLGPTSQDFRASFGLGDDTSINTLDADGVLFASVQGLVQELEERDRTMAWEKLQSASALAERDGEIESLKKDIRELKNRIDSMLPPSTVKK